MIIIGGGRLPNTFQSHIESGPRAHARIQTKLIWSAAWNRAESGRKKNLAPKQSRNFSLISFVVHRSIPIRCLCVFVCVCASVQCPFFGFGFILTHYISMILHDVPCVHLRWAVSTYKHANTNHFIIAIRWRETLCARGEDKVDDDDGIEIQWTKAWANEC